MSKFESQVKALQHVFIGVAVLWISLIWSSMSAAQNKSDHAKGSNPHAQHQEKQPAGGQDASGQMPGMSGQKEDSAWWFDKYSRGQKPDMGGMDMPDGEGDMAGMTGMAKGKMEGASTAGNSSSPGMGMKDDIDLMGMMEVDLDMMGAIGIAGAGSKGMKRIGEIKVASSLPGSPGVSRLYHVGATGFFLNHSEHVSLSTVQQTAINVIKGKALLSMFTARRKIDEAEQELWELTGADEPDAARIQDKVQAIEKLRGEHRMAFIQSVAEAAIVLTDEQRQMLIGTKADETATTDARASHEGTKSGTPDTSGAGAQLDHALDPARQ